ncbi:hypothetical protein GJ496_007688 [Pomphorhynchus laevis]|nr:hypothetical protein GJ496_007688 [Pomphorhynchus laevis]
MQMSGPKLKFIDMEQRKIRERLFAKKSYKSLNECSEIKERIDAISIEQTKWENMNSGGFRKVYPLADRSEDKYTMFIDNCIKQEEIMKQKMLEKYKYGILKILVFILSPLA